MPRQFWPFFWTQLAGAFNDNLFKNALGLLVVYQGMGIAGVSPEVFVPVASAVFMAPFFLFSAVGGQLADKLDKAALMRRIKLAEIGIMAVAALGLFIGSMELLLVVLFAMGTQSALFGPVKYGVLPQLLDDEQLVGGNALVELATYLAILGGTLAGGVLVASQGGESVALAVLVVAFLGWVASTRVPALEPAAPGLSVGLDPIRPTLDIVRLALRNRVILLSILGISWFWTFGTVVLALFPTYTKDVLGADEGVATLFLAAFSVGIGAGSVLCERLSKHRLELGVVPIGALGMSLFCLDLWWLGSPWPADGPLLGVSELLARPGGVRVLVDLTLLATSGGLYIVPMYTMIQLRSEPSERSRVIAGNNIVNAGFMVAGSVLLVLARSRLELDEPALFAALAVLNAVAALVIFTQVQEFGFRFLVWVLSSVMYRVRVVGHDHLPREGGCVVVANHVSFIDWFILGGALRRPVHFVMDVSFAHLPVLRWFARQEMVIPIASPRRDEVTYEQAFVSIRRKLRDGWVVGIFPEGRITADGAVAEFKHGITKIVERDPVPVVPVALNGLWGSWFSRKGGAAMLRAPRRFWSRVQVTVGRPIPPEEVTPERLRDAVLALYEAGGPP